MTTYEEIFTLELEDVEHGDPHLLFEQWSEALNSSSNLSSEVKIKWDCEDHEYSFMVEHEE